MARRNEVAVVQMVPITEDTRNKVIVTIDGQDLIRDINYFGITFDSTDNEIMEAVAPAVREELGRDISRHYKVRKAPNSQNIYIIPNSTAG